MIQEQEEKELQNWVEDVISENWRDQIRAIKNWKRVALLVGFAKTRDDVIRYLLGTSPLII